MENAAADGLLSLSRQPGQILVKLKSSGSALEVKNGLKMGKDDASASGTPPAEVIDGLIKGLPPEECPDF